VKKFRKLFKLGVSLMAALSAIAAMGVSVNACHFWFAQPEVPQGMDKFRNENK
jgi:cyclic lactone autoinducer peptide